MIIAKKRVGIFAGSFDPIHDGHIAVANSCIENLELDKIYFMVEPQPWGNKSPVNIKHRRKMVELVTREYTNFGQLELYDKQFCIDSTLKKLENQFPGSELYFIFGGDIFIKMNKQTWPELDKLLEHYIVVIERGKITEEDISHHAMELGIVTAILPSEHLHHSSTDIRLNPHNKSIWVPKLVGEYIDFNKLYSKY
jgi:nicotinate-nucleotide adenylyltransferase